MCVFTHHFTVLKDQQKGNGLNTLAEALKDVRMLQHSEHKTTTGMKSNAMLMIKGRGHCNH